MWLFFSSKASSDGEKKKKLEGTSRDTRRRFILLLRAYSVQEAEGKYK